MALEEHRPTQPKTRAPFVSFPGQFPSAASGPASTDDARLDALFGKQCNDRDELLAGETVHRAQNLLALVQAIVRLTKADSVQELKTAITGRIDALAIVHTLLAKSRWMGAELQDLIEQELAPYCFTRDPRIQIAGPRLLLDPTGAQSIALVLHELTTNAAKYGALSVGTGHIRIEWTYAEDRRLALRWFETGGPSVVPPKKQGLGTVMVERTVCHQLNGTVSFDWRAEGLVCELAIPNDKLVRI